MGLHAISTVTPVTPLYDSVLSAAAASFDVQSISAGYNDLLLRFMGRCAGAVTTDTVIVRFNNDSGTNYHRVLEYGRADATTAATGNASATGSWIGDIPGATATAAYAGLYEMTISSYSLTTFNKIFRSHGGFARGTATTDIYEENVFGMWLSTVAINRVTVSMLGGSNFDAGSRLAIYGLS